VLGRDYDSQTCSIARALEVVGERWTILILRNVALGVHRFDEQQRQLGVARNVLAARLERLVEEGILERRPYAERPIRHEYHFTDKGRALGPLLVELKAWGDRYVPAPGGPPLILRHGGCGGVVGTRCMCERCGELVTFEDLVPEAGPGADASARVRLPAQAAPLAANAARG
jgi:DNA-binding HxlR family transcriptional regulator